MNLLNKKLFAIITALILLLNIGIPAAADTGKKVYLSKTSISMEIGETATVKLVNASGTVKWSVSDKKVITCSKGVVTAVGKGTAYVYAVNNGYRYKCKVTVKNASGIYGTKSAVTIAKGSSSTVKVYLNGASAKIYNSNGGVCKLAYSLKKGVVTLKITGKKAGTAKITIYNKKNKSDRFDINVTVKGDNNTEIIVSDTDTGELSVEESIDRVIELVNEERRKAGVSELKRSDELMRCAAIRAEELTVKYSHYRPDGSEFYTVLPNMNFSTCGENIAQGYTTADFVMEGWMNSEGHKKNILNPDFTEIGVGYDPGTKSWVQIFRG